MNPETTAMLRNVILHARDFGKNDAEIVTMLASVAVELSKDKPEPAQSKPATKPAYKHDIATGPAVEWKPPVGGFYRHDGRFVRDETWKPVEEPIEQAREYSVPEIKITNVPNTGAHNIGVAGDGRAKISKRLVPSPFNGKNPKATEKDLISRTE